MASSRQILVDDIDTAIHYSGESWFQEGTFQDQPIGYDDGRTYRTTSHVAEAGNGSFSFSFEGTSILLYGRSTPTDAKCLVDGITIEPFKPTRVDFSLEDFVLCKPDVLKDGPHTVTVNGSSGSDLWFDYLVFTPSPQASFENVNLIMKNNDSSVALDSNWLVLDDLFRVTTVQGSRAKVNFTGKSLAWVGFIFPPVDGTSQGSFSIDGGPPNVFHLPEGIYPPLESTGSIIYFTTMQLTQGPHSLLLVYNGTPHNPSSQFILDYLYITGASMNWPPSVTTPPSSSGAPSSSIGLETPHQSPPTPMGAIVGGAVGGLTLIVTFLCVIVWLHRNQRRRTVGGPIPSLTSSRRPLIPFIFTSGFPQLPHIHKSQSTENSNALTLNAPPFTKSPVFKLHIHSTRTLIDNEPSSRPPPHFHQPSMRDRDNMLHVHSTSANDSPLSEQFAAGAVTEVQVIHSVQDDASIVRQSNASEYFPGSTGDPPPSYASVA